MEEDLKQQAPQQVPQTGAVRTLREQIADSFPHEPVDIRSYSPLALAFLGDAVYSLIIRSALLLRGNRQAEKLHNETTFYVCAPAQARIADAITDLLTEEEAAVLRRGRNANPYHYAKSATTGEYRKATALETLCGYLFLTDRTERLLELLQAGIERTTGKV